MHHTDTQILVLHDSTSCPYHTHRRNPWAVCCVDPSAQRVAQHADRSCLCCWPAPSRFCLPRLWLLLLVHMLTHAPCSIRISLTFREGAHPADVLFTRLLTTVSAAWCQVGQLFAVQCQPMTGAIRQTSAPCTATSLAGPCAPGQQDKAQAAMGWGLRGALALASMKLAASSICSSSAAGRMQGSGGSHKSAHHPI